MDIQVRSSNGITVAPLESQLLNERKIFLEGEIDAELSMRVAKQLIYLVNQDRDRIIKILINTPGGEVNSGMMIYDMLRTCKTPLELYCMGRAYSMGALIFASGTKGRRYMLENSQLMIHEPLLGGQIGGKSTSIKSISDSLQETKKKLNRILARHTGKTEEEIENATSYDHYFQAEEAISFGLADKVVSFSDIAPQE